MSDVFVSYDRESHALAEALAEDIRELGHTVWLDRELTGGQPWWDRILAQIRVSDVLVYVLTPRSIDSTACQRECDYAAALGKTVLPVLAAEGVSTNLLPPALAQLQFVDYRTRDRAAALRLARAFGVLPPTRPLPDPLPEAPEVPSSYLGGVAHRLASPAILSHEVQSTLLIDLKGSLRVPETAEDARSLLKQFRKRRDLLASIADEIDELLERAVPTPQQEAPREERAAPIAVAAPPVATRAPSPLVPGAPTPRDRLQVALIGAVLGTVVGVLAMATASVPLRRVWVFGLLTGAGAPVAGAIGGKRRTVMVTALIVAVVGWFATSVITSVITAGPSAKDAVAVGGVFSAPLGAMLGAIAGVIYLRLHRDRTGGILKQ